MRRSINICGLTIFAARDGERVTGRIEFPEVFRRDPVPIDYHSHRPDEPSVSPPDPKTKRRIDAVRRYRQLRDEHPNAPRQIHFDQVAREFDCGLRTLQIWVQKHVNAGDAGLGDRYTPAPRRVLTADRDQARAAVMVCAWWCFRIANCPSIDTKMMHVACGLVARGFEPADILATIEDIATALELPPLVVVFECLKQRFPSIANHSTEPGRLVHQLIDELMS